MKGEVIGINAAKYSSTDVEGIGYAIPVSKVEEILNQLMNRRTMNPVAEDRRGYLVYRESVWTTIPPEALACPRALMYIKFWRMGRLPEVI